LKFPLFNRIFFKNDTIFISSRAGIEIFTYEADQENIVLIDSVCQWYTHIDNVFGDDSIMSKAKFKIISEDTIEITHSRFVETRFRFVKESTIPPCKIEKAIVTLRNGWNTQQRIELLSSGKFNIMVENVWEHSHKYMTGSLDEDVNRLILLNLNDQFNQKLLPKEEDNCSDCPEMLVQIQRNDTVKSFFSKMYFHRFSFAINSIRNLFKRDKLYQVNEIPKTEDWKYIYSDTLFIVKQNNNGH